MVGGSNPPRVVSFAHFLYFVLMIFWYFSDISYLSLELITGYLPCLLFVLSFLYHFSALLQMPRPQTSWSYCGWMFMSSLPSLLLFFFAFDTAATVTHNTILFPTLKTPSVLARTFFGTVSVFTQSTNLITRSRYKFQW